MNTVISLAMRPLISAVAALSLLLSACNSPLQLPSDDPNLLTGTWSGTFTQTNAPILLRADTEQVYLKRAQKLEVRDAHTGAVLASRQIPGLLAAAWRSDGVLVVLTPTSLVTYDPLTLTPKAEQTLSIQATETNSYLSFDGAILGQRSQNNDLLYYDTHTFQLLPAAQAPQGLYPNASDNMLRWGVYSKNATIPANTKDVEYTVFNLHTGASFALPHHAVAPGCQWYDYNAPQIQTAILSDGTERLLISYADGQTEIRTTDGTLINTIALNGCEIPHLFLIAGQVDEIAYSRVNKINLLSAATGQTLKEFDNSNIDHLGTSGALLLVDSTALSYKYQGFDGSLWAIENPVTALKMDVKTNWTGDDGGSVSGTAIINNETFDLNGFTSLHGIKIKAQTLPGSPTSYAQIDLLRNNQKVGQLLLENHLDTDKTPEYSGSLSLDDGTYWNGQIKRP